MVCGIQVTVVQEKSVLSRTSQRAGIGDLEWHRQGVLIRWFQQSHCQLAKHRDYAQDPSMSEIAWLQQVCTHELGRAQV
jgi:hypothetical protein